MKRFLFSIFAGLIALSAQADLINGAGASFPAPIYFKWANTYYKETGNKINYASIGSGGGIKQIDSKIVDFGATDDPRTLSEISTIGQLQFPTVMGGVVPVFNIKGVSNLVLDGPTLADIFQGKITVWNDPQIAKLNTGVNLPSIAITLITRADSSGTSAVFTDYLSMVSTQFKETIGKSKTPRWKGNVASGKGNAGVAAFVKQIPGGIGYVEYAFVKQGKLNAVSLKNKHGQLVDASASAFLDAAASADWSVPGMIVNLNNQDKGWPITAATFILVYKEGNPNTQNVLKFFDWAFTRGDALALELEYVPLPKSVQSAIRDVWSKNIK